MNARFDYKNLKINYHKHLNVEYHNLRMITEQQPLSRKEYPVFLRSAFHIREGNKISLLRGKVNKISDSKIDNYIKGMREDWERDF